MKYGDPDGHGHYGMLETDEDGLLVCHECGEPWQHLATHARATHSLLAADYRERHGLARTRTLVAPATADRMRDAWEDNREAHMSAIEQARDPQKARLRSPVGHKGQGRGSSAPEVLAGYQQRARARRGRKLTTEEAATLGGGLDLQAWADAARVLLEQDGVTSRSLAEASDIAVSTVAQRLRRYPRSR